MIRNITFLTIALFLLTNCSHLFKKKPPPSIETPEQQEIIAENYVSDAIDFYQAGQYSKAIDTWHKALRIIPNDAEVHNFVGLAHHRMGDLDSAIVSFETAVEIDPKYHQAWNNLGYMNFLQGKYEKALRYFDEALLVNPNYEQARLNRQKTAEIIDGRLKIQAFELVEKTARIDSLELQILNYRQALEVDSNYVDAWNNLGVAYFYYSNFDSAVICLKKALDINPDYPPAHNNAGYILDALGEYDQAISHYQKAIKLRPTYVIAMANLVDTYVHKKDYESAKTILQGLREMDPNNYLVRQRIEEYQELLFGNMPEGGQ
jgi:tetratricopeptide (TPR) repeat protein